MNFRRPATAFPSGGTTTMARPWARSSTSPTFRSWIRSRSVSCSTPPTVSRSVSCLPFRLVHSASAQPCSNRCISIWSARTSWSVFSLTALLVCLHRHGDRSGSAARRPLVPGEDLLLSRPRLAFRRPFANYVGWAVVGLISLAIYFPLDRRLPRSLAASVGHASTPAGRRPYTMASWPSISA